MPPDLNDLLPGLDEDYVAEADEHLTGIRRGLLALEASDAALPSPSLLEELFRHFHSLKGLSGMVGLREAEQLAHDMESYLRALRQNRAPITPQGIEALMTGTRLLDQVTAAYRAREQAPDIANALLLLEAIIPVESREPSSRAPAAPSPTPHVLTSIPNDLSAEETGRVNAAVERGDAVWHCVFTPSPALSERGVNVTSIRARLNELGELIHAAPRVTPTGGIAFEFVVATAPAADWEPFNADGLEQKRLSVQGKKVSPPKPAYAPAPAPGIASSHTVRVELERLDDLMRMVGDLVITRARLEDSLGRLEKTLPASALRPFEEINTAFERQLRDLREGVMHVRLVPIGEVFERMQFVVRDLAQESGKRVRLRLSGQETEIDKLIVERMMDPLLHLVRNAVSHGLETPAERAGDGKPEEGTIRLRASAAGDVVRIEVQDDGRGIDVEAVTQRARALNLIGPDQKLDMLSLVDVISLPGFTTREQADRASGRGVGMSVVRSTVQELGGTITVESQRGQGTCFALELPLTLAIADALVVAVGNQRFAVPLPSVREVMEVQPTAIKFLENNEIIPYRGAALPLVRLARLFRLVEQPGRALYALVVGSGAGMVGLLADRLLGQREIVVHALADPLVRTPGISGATDLGDGRIVLIVDTAAILRLVLKTERRIG